MSSTLDTVRKIQAVLEMLCSTGNESETYNLILVNYDLIAVEFLLDIDDLPFC